MVEDGRETVVARHVLDPGRRDEDRRWVDVRADLAAFAGRTVRIRLATAPADPARPGTSLPAWADPVVLAPRAAGPPNVILMSLDTLRAKSVSAYGSPRPTTPNLDQLVGDAGIVFDDADTTAPHTLWAHMSIFTGRYVRDLGDFRPLRPLSGAIATLPERLRASGWDTAAFTEDGFVMPDTGFRRGFASYHENTSPNLHEPLGQSAKTFHAAIDWLAERRDRPTFLFVHTYEVHFPYTPPPPYDEAFEPASGRHGPNARELLRYEQETRYLDDEIRAFLEALDGLGLGTRTLLVVTSDHGEEFLEHGRTRHGSQVYDESIHVPLMMRWPAVVPAGRRIGTPVSLVDVAPTILDLVGAPPLLGTNGESLVPLFTGGSFSERRHAVFSEAASSMASGWDVLGVRLRGVHCIYRTRQGASECYDGETDPDERAPLRSGDARVLDARAEAVTFRALGPATPVVPSVSADAATEASQDPADAERREKLKALGYAQ
jgi:arylsulfatase A-like enzyme